MTNNIEEYINKNPESYLGHYCKGLKGLDTYFEQGGGIAERYIRAFKTAANLIRREDIIKYYFLSILISRDKRKIKKFHKYEKEVQMVFNSYKFKLINCTIQYFRKWRPKLSSFKKCEYFDSIDYLILYVLEKEYKIKVLENYNYIYESIKQGRRSSSLIKAMLSSEAYKKEDIEEIVEKYPSFFENIKDTSVYRFILEQEYITRVWKRNVALVEKIIQNQQEALSVYGLGDNRSISLNAEKNNKKMIKLLDKYIYYCIYNNRKNKAIVEQYETYLIENINEATAMYLYSNEIKLNSVIKRLETAFKDKIHFSKVELMYMKKFGILNISTEECNVYKLNFHTELWEGEVEVHFIVDDEIIKSECYWGYENYYVFKESPSTCRVLSNNCIIEGAVSLVKV